MSHAEFDIDTKSAAALVRAIAECWPDRTASSASDRELAEAYHPVTSAELLAELFASVREEGRIEERESRGKTGRKSAEILASNRLRKALVSNFCEPITYL